MIKFFVVLTLEKYVKHTSIFKVNYACCAHITDFSLIAYQRILAVLTHETKAYKLRFLLIYMFAVQTKELTPYKAMNFT